jgi:hypothetical protein
MDNRSAVEIPRHRSESRTDEARRLIEKHGYWRRKEALEDAEAWLGGGD